MSGHLELFAVAAPGLEGVVATELQQLGIPAVAEPGGAGWEGDLESLYTANLHLRTASRIVARIARFRARSFIELERHLRRIGWAGYARSGGSIRLRVSSRKSKLYHQRAIAERFAREIEQVLGAAIATEGSSATDDEDESSQGQLFIVRFLRDECVVSVDSSGELMHRRGYRQAVARAPLRETLAAALLITSGWKPPASLLDPFCGAGTIPIEAALIAQRIPPGLASADRALRAYAFESWPTFDPATLRRVVERAQAEIRAETGAVIQGSDRDRGAVEAARANSERAGVAEHIGFEERALSAINPPAAAGFLVTNPPYGVRVGDRHALRDLYGAFGNVVRARLPGWRVTMLSADEMLERQTGLELREVVRTVNGGIPVRMVTNREQGTGNRGQDNLLSSRTK